MHRASPMRIEGPPGDGAESRNRFVERELARALDDFIAAGHWRAADRLVATAMRLPELTDDLRERIARLHFHRGHHDAAMALLEVAPDTAPSSTRLLHAACLFALGRFAEAHDLLRSWTAEGSVPLDARVLLANLERAAGLPVASRMMLARNLHDPNTPRDVRTLLALLSDAVLDAHASGIEQWATTLATAATNALDAERVRLALSTLAPHAIRRHSQPIAEDVARLAVELRANEELLPAIVESLVLAPAAASAAPSVEGVEQDELAARLMRDALVLIFDQLTAQHAGYVCIAQLCEHLGDLGPARQWTSRGLARYAQSPALAALADRLGATADTRAVIGVIRPKPQRKERAA